MVKLLFVFRNCARARMVKPPYQLHLTWRIIFNRKSTNIDWLTVIIYEEDKYKWFLLCRDPHYNLQSSCFMVLGRLIHSFPHSSQLDWVHEQWPHCFTSIKASKFVCTVSDISSPARNLGGNAFSSLNLQQNMFLHQLVTIWFEYLMAGHTFTSVL